MLNVCFSFICSIIMIKKVSGSMRLAKWSKVGYFTISVRSNFFNYQDATMKQKRLNRFLQRLYKYYKNTIGFETLTVH